MTSAPVTRPIILITGIPASGKTTLAREIAKKLQLPLLSKDVIKESLFDSLGVRDREWSRRLGAASNDAIWNMLKECYGGAVIETWLDPTRDDEQYAKQGLASAGIRDVYEILCECDGKVAAERYTTRIRHNGHAQADQEILNRIQDSASLMKPLGVGKSFTINTSTHFDYEPVYAWLSNELKVYVKLIN